MFFFFRGKLKFLGSVRASGRVREGIGLNLIFLVPTFLRGALVHNGKKIPIPSPLTSSASAQRKARFCLIFISLVLWLEYEMSPIASWT